MRERLAVPVSRRLTAEFIGTLLLLTTVVGSGIMGDQLADGNDAIALLANSIATGAILVVLILMFGPLSGGHFNPAVTLAFLLKGDIAIKDAVLYWLVQIVGGILGVWLAHGMFEQALLQTSHNPRTGSGQWLAEIVATFGLVATIICVLRWRQEAVAYAVGLYITAAYWFTASTSFANPAVTIARGFTDTFSGIQPEHVGGFVAAQLIGAVMATLLMRWLLNIQED